MKRTTLTVILLLSFFACKKERDPVTHSVQFSSNISDPAYYLVTINSEANKSISETYSVASGSDIELRLFAAGGDTTAVDEGDSAWVRGGIIVDGKPVSSFAGYRDATLFYHITE